MRHTAGMVNRLGSSSSPYLQQHAGNPVHWWEWSPEAFAEAKRRDVPVFISVGYAACHWCHVMAHESFEDPDIAALLNDNFVAIKVDREERPDVDAVYMRATQALTGQGGWPMSVFATPEGKPFFAGTYFPDTRRGGMPGFDEVLTALAGAWADRRDEVTESATAIVDQLREISEMPAPGAKPTPAEVLAALANDYDQAHGGFRGAPKFPPHTLLPALLTSGDPTASEQAHLTLRQMADGGIYDQLGGGFHRYSVDAHWQVPHFEKMLYDNALLIEAYAIGARTAPDELTRRRYTEVLADTIDWLVRDLAVVTGEEWAFASSLDADSADIHGNQHEGIYYAWSPALLRDALGTDDAGWVADLCGVTDEGTFEHGLSTLRRLREPAEDERRRWQEAKLLLRAERGQRFRPGRDDKVVAAWNGWLAAALVVAGTALERRDWIDLAEGIATHLHRVHTTTGGLARVSMAGEVGPARGLLEDHAAVALAYARLAIAGRDQVWQERATALMQAVVDQYAVGDGLADTAADAEELILRPRDPHDSPTPSGLGGAVAAARLLAELGDSQWDQRAERWARSADAVLSRTPRSAGSLVRDLLRS